MVTVLLLSELKQLSLGEQSFVCRFHLNSHLLACRARCERHRIDETAEKRGHDENLFDGGEPALATAL
jgi:hypothetical protein